MRRHRVDTVTHLRYTLDTYHDRHPDALLFRAAARGSIIWTHAQDTVGRAAGAAGANTRQDTPHSAGIGLVNAMLAADYTIIGRLQCGRMRGASWR